MKKRCILLILFIVIYSLCSLSFASAPETTIFNAKNGDVTFNHLKHSSELECIKCHHGDERVVCSSCHGVDADAPTMKKALHKNCKKCHKILKKGPIKCKQCHVK